MFGLAIGFGISMLDPFIYTEKIRLLAPPGFKNTALGLVTIITLLVALLAQPLMGRRSDQTRSRWGKRAPYLAAGSIGICLSLALLILSNNLWLFILAAMLVSACSNTTQVAWQALIPDHVPESQRGTAAGIKTLWELVGAVSGVGLAGFMLAQGNLWGTPLAAMSLYLTILIITLLALRRTTGPIALPAVLSFQNPFSALAASVRRAPPAFLWWMLNRFLFWSSAIAVRTFLLNYLEDVLGLSWAEAQTLSSHLFILLGVGVFILALPAGAIADRIGRRPIVLLAGWMAAAGVVLFMVWRDLNLLFIAGGLIAGGAGIFAGASWALATDLAPKDEGALYLALANTATALGSIGGRLGGPLIDGVNQLLGTTTSGYLVVYSIAALFFAGSSLIVFKITPTSLEAQMASSTLRPDKPPHFRQEGETEP
jgi:MFS family permease